MKNIFDKVCKFKIRLYICIVKQLKQSKMKAQINKVNEGAVKVSLFNEKRIVNQKWFDTERKALNFCKKYNYEVCQMNENIDYAEQFNQ